MFMPGRYSMLLTMPLLLLGGCGEEAPKKKQAVDTDPALAGALADQIMVDPDLASANPASAGIAIGGGDGALPPENNSPEVVAAARSKALELVGGAGKMKTAPTPRIIAEGAGTGPVIASAARAASLGPNGVNCGKVAGYTMAWAAKMPVAFPVYPRGNVQESAGTDSGGCALRVVTFTTPVALEEVMNFYYTRALAAGYKADRIRQGGEDMLGGAKGGMSYLVSAQKLSSGRTQVDLVTSGG